MRPSPRELCLILAAALGYFLAFPNPVAQLPILALATPACLFLLAAEAGGRARAVFFSFLGLLLGSSLALYWLAIPMHNFGGVPWLLAAFFVLLLGLIFGAHGSLFALLVRLFIRRLPFWPAVLGLAVAWGMLEHLRGWICTGFPWLSLSSAFAGWPVLAQGAAILGMYALSAFYALIALLLALFWKSRRGEDLAALFPAAGPRPLPGRRPLLALPLALLALAAIYGLTRLERDWSGQPDRPGPAGQENALLVTLVQGNTDQKQKWTADYRSQIIGNYLELSRRALTRAQKEHGRKPDLLLWPETAMPFAFQKSPYTAGPIRQLARESGVPLLFGTQGLEADLEKEPYPELSPIFDYVYNRVLLLDQLGRESGSYDKEHLVPFGEYLPPGLSIPFATEFLQGTGFTPGQPGPPPLKSGRAALGLLICYEVIFPELAQARVAAGANLLVSVSNDAWFGKSSAPLQHLQLAAMRCIEQGRYMARATNTGISAVIDPCGRVSGAGPLFEARARTEPVWPLREITIFHRGYDWISGALWVIPLSLMLWAALRRAAGRRGKPARS
ncbi:MAG: apolipoprotein N-acyltransferase [Deltaproteobacteria bacterium]|jgi:apolipoprotein N-acyltransferase|nr:apolipoprotein N-acyltransferase [Deltaproteobacteria bacterium]